VLCIISPAINLFCRKTPILTLGIIFAFWLLQKWQPSIPSSEATLFFTIGCAIAVNNKNIFQFDFASKYFYLAYIITLTIENLLKESIITPYIHKIGILIGVVSILSLTKIVVKNERITNSLINLSTASFFIFATHEPLLTVFRKIIFKTINPNTQASLIILYISTPIIITYFLTKIYQKISKNFPNTMKLIVGVRE
jgi:peptidoglycan/LPS O-acetylase OafA/YrhL